MQRTDHCFCLPFQRSAPPFTSACFWHAPFKHNNNSLILSFRTQSTLTFPPEAFAYQLIEATPFDYIQDERSHQLERYVETRSFSAHALWLLYLHRSDERIKCRDETSRTLLILLLVGQAGCQIANSCWEVSHITSNVHLKGETHKD